MKVLGIEIKGREVRIIALEENSSGQINDITGGYKPIKLEDDEIAQNVILFRKSLHATFESFNPDIITIRWRNPKPAKFDQSEKNLSASPISFKIEGIIQSFESADVRLIKPQTSTAFIKKNPLPFKAKYSYQEEALKIAYYQIKNL
ncbi:DUF3010 family protein [Flavobacterium collinsii]|uniref:DUF3010 domain-containing protein n=1 Tax=Flavobacterium collinsii TaxID=1114861 RepID=A0ABM8KJW3_9FLAO|nr:DUF3010 family protein [Flavobacterium collinsii]CAA9199457.1 hypothetical protein FLACOL7796_02735 [Flavobacterium collinsii]